MNSNPPIASSLRSGKKNKSIWNSCNGFSAIDELNPLKFLVCSMFLAFQSLTSCNVIVLSYFIASANVAALDPNPAGS